MTNVFTGFEYIKFQSTKIVKAVSVVGISTV